MQLSDLLGKTRRFRLAEQLRAVDQRVIGFVELTDLHDIDAVRRTGAYLYIAAVQLVAEPKELRALVGRNYKGLDAPHPQAGGYHLEHERLARSRCSEYGHIGVIMELCVERVYRTYRVVEAVNAEHHSAVVPKLERREHI